jgi:hypothetical protein
MAKPKEDVSIFLRLRNLCRSRKPILTLLVLAFLSFSAAHCYGSESMIDYNLNREFMEATFYIIGPSTAVGQASYGTVFCLLKPFAGEELKADRHGSLVLVTAKHVLENIAGDVAQLHLRRQDGAGKWSRAVVDFKIRNKGKNLYVSHPTMDAAAMQLDYGLAEKDKLLIRSIKPIPYELLASDAIFTALRLNPGSILMCLGFPLTLTSNDAGFPILRGGMIASYPLLPLTDHPVFVFDFEVYPGNSGGPVYYFEPGYESTGNDIFKLTKTPSLTIAGLVTQQSEVTLSSATPGGLTSTERIQPKLGNVITGPFIKETIEMLPPVKPK